MYKITFLPQRTQMNFSLDFLIRPLLLCLLLACRSVVIIVAAKEEVNLSQLVLICDLTTKFRCF